MPSIVWGTQGLMAAECLAGRVPALVPAMGGLAEQVRDGVDGLHFDGRDHDSLARAIERLANEPGLLERLQAGIAAPATFAAHVDALEACYRGERPAPERTRRRPSGAPCAGSATTTSTPASRSSTRRSSGGCAATRACASSASSAPA